MSALPAVNPDLDLTLTRIIRAPRAAVWRAWADPRRFEQWWIPAPTLCKVVAMDLSPGGAFVTRMSDDGGSTFGPHIDGCFLDIETEKRLVFTTALTGGWRPAANPFITAVITFGDHPDGTEYAAHVMHKDKATREQHETLGFFDGWGTVFGQLARLVEGG